MSKILRVLNIDESERDALLLRSHLAHADYELVFERVNTPAATKAALERREWDVILADYAMPAFGPLETLTILADTGLDTPVIVISETRVGPALPVGWRPSSCAARGRWA